ncbi:MAG: glucose-1-phosphate adenylyltransferase subunit GlgD [Firmicutes bacterium]|nr:glucose-1-phosphate adenylyltransferase subunit GlgD [Bacillota bacterium]MBQ9708839.1 glucose-1-phosphate adenylyltransferase subunit GlgD [Bacillota bacterium]
MKAIGIISANYVSGDFDTLTNKRTLASIPFGGRYRLIDFALSNMANSGITTVGVIAPYNSGSLIDHIGVGKPWSLDKKIGGLFVMPGSVFGVTMSGNRFLMRDLIANKAFLEKDDADYVVVTGSSDVYNMDYMPLVEAHHKSGRPITLVTKRVHDAEHYRGFFITKDDDGKVNGISTKSFGDADYFIDCFVVDRKFLLDFIGWFETLEYMDAIDILDIYLDRFEVGTYEFEGYYGKINSLVTYWRRNMDLLHKEVVNELFNGERTIYTKVQDEPPADFNAGSNVKNSLIAAGCNIKGTVENSIIFRSCNIAEGAVIKNSIILQHADIGKNVVLDRVIFDKYVTAKEGVEVRGGNETPIVIDKGSNL